MGLCKCPKKRVTQQFCFEHCVNVCEFCMVDSHPSCIVQPYLQWLEDSTYISKCSFCQLDLNKEECVRLLCYHVFHWMCLNKHCSGFPPDTAPAGYTCPDCNFPIFPSNNTPSPIYTVLKKKLYNIEWARIGLNLSTNSIVNNSQELSDKKNIYSEEKLKIDSNLHHPFETKIHTNPNIIVYHTQNNLLSSQSIPVAINNSASHITNNFVKNNFNSSNTSSRKFSNNKYSNETHSLIVDIDEDKYRQRTYIEKISRYLKFHQFDKNFQGYRAWVILGIVSFFLISMLFYFLVKLGRESAESDPLLDPKFNPNLHIETNIDKFE